MPKLDLDTIPFTTGSGYPPPLDAPVAGRVVRNLSAPAGATDWVANHVTVPPGGWSSQRHWHEGEDEIVVMLAGTAVLVDDDGRHAMHPGDVAIFPKGDRNGHHLVNESSAPCVFVALGLPEDSPCHYPDADLLWTPEAGDTHVDGTPY